MAAKSLTVHVIGADKEAEMVKTFLECARLLYPLSLQIHLVGNAIPDELNGSQGREENLSFRMSRGLYHEINVNNMQKPDFVVCFNGGLGAYSSFIPTVKMMAEKHIPVFYTDYGLACISFTRKTLQQSQSGTVMEAKLNPFRCPLRITSMDQNVPRYSNAFITHIKPFENKLTDGRIQDLNSGITQMNCR